MKDLYHALRDFIRKDFEWAIYGPVMLYLGISIFINYTAVVDLDMIPNGRTVGDRIIYFGLLYGVAYYLAAFIGQWKTDTNYLKDWRFWVTSLGLVVIALLPKLHYFKLIDALSMEGSIGEKQFVSKCHFFVNQLFLTVVGLGIMWVVLRKWVSFDVGLRGGWKKLKPYFLILAMVTPLIVAASFLPDFQRAYPQYKPWQFQEVFGLSMQQRAAIFEVSYATGFVAVESLFRGAMAITMVRIMGPRAVLAMASLYCVFHFGKPAGEAVAAFFGGYALGVLAIHSRSILGGLVVHLGVAMLMESLGYLHHFTH